MDKLEKAVEVVQKIADRYDESAMQKARDKMSLLDIGEHVIKNGRIPIMTNDKDVKAFIKKFQLYKPENMIRFFVEANFAAFESTKESINKLNKTILSGIISKIPAAKDHIADAVKHKEDEEKELEAAKNLLDEAIANLQQQITNNIENIREIDNRSKWQFFLKSRVSLTDIDTYVGCAALSLQVLVQAVEAQRQIVALKKRTDDPASVVRCRRFVEEKILSGDTCSLMHAYDKDKEKGFWLKIEHVCQNIIQDKNELAEYVDEYDEIDFS